MKPKLILTGIIVLMVFIECAVLAQYTLAPDGFGSNTSISANITQTSPTQTVAKKTTTAASTTAVKTTAKPTATSTKTPTKTATTKPTPTPTVYTSSQVKQHFLDIAFDPNNPTISKPTSSTAKIAITGTYDASDIAAISNFEQQFNLHSTTLSLPSSPVENSQGFIVINYMPETSLESLTKDTTYNDINTKQIINRETDATIGSIYRTTGYYSTSTNFIYLNSDFSDDLRQHYAIRGILYNLGFPGESTYKDSVFYSEANSNVNLSTIDWKAVDIMYGTRMKNGMSRSTASALL